MLNIKKLRIMILSLFLLGSSIANNVAADANPPFCHHTHQRFHLSDFAGDWVFIATSIGGISGNSGYSSTQITHFTLNRKGQGTTNFLQQSIYTGPVGTPLIVQDLTELVDISLVLQNKKIGLGTITLKFNINNQPITLVSDFLPITSNGRIVEFSGHIVNTNTGSEFPSSVGTFTAKRQLN